MSRYQILTYTEKCVSRSHIIFLYDLLGMYGCTGGKIRGGKKEEGVYK